MINKEFVVWIDFFQQLIFDMDNLPSEILFPNPSGLNMTFLWIMVVLLCVLSDVFCFLILLP